MPILLAILSAVAQAQVPSVAAPVAKPKILTAGVPAKVVLSVRIAASGNAVVPNSVNLLQVDAGGRVLSTAATMQDAGYSGDAVANDGIYSAEISINQAAPAVMYYRASAAFFGLLQRVVSLSAIVQVVPVGAPTAPAPMSAQVVATRPTAEPSSATRFSPTLAGRRPIRPSNNWQPIWAPKSSACFP